jgi:spermidine synthase
MASIGISETRGVRYLHLGSELIQGAMRIARPWALELEYTRDMMMPLLLREDAAWPKSVLQVGLGSASLTKFLYRHRPEAAITAVEILPEVVAAARQYFKLPDDDARLRIVIDDGATFMATSKRRFDLILVDGFDADGRTGMLDTVPFYMNCRERMAAGGMMTVNLLTRRKRAAPSEARLREAFGEHVALMPPSGAGNAVALASRGPAIDVEFTELRAARARLREATGLDLAPSLVRLSGSSHAHGERFVL